MSLLKAYHLQNKVPHQVPSQPQNFNFNILCTLIKMSDSPIHMDIDSKNEDSFLVGTRVSPSSTISPSSKTS